MPEAQATLVVAGISVRLLAEAAAQGGWRVIAFDLFGDLDTRRASARWADIGTGAGLAIDGPRLREALAVAAREPGVVGWVAGSGFDGATALLDSAPPGLPLIGMAADAVRALRDPRHFFATLDRLGLAHPEVMFEAPHDADGSTAGWLVKRAGGTGGWHIRRAAPRLAPHDDDYFQRAIDGEPMSALFIADGQAARLIALNTLTVRALGAHPHVYRGAIGPIDRPRLQTRVEAALALLVPAFGLRGLASLDFIAVDDTPQWLEINPRPSASIGLHARAWPGGLMRAHVDAVRGVLPPPPSHSPGQRGAEIVYTRHACVIDAEMAAMLSRQPDLHDLPAAGTRLGSGEPVCSVSAGGHDAAAVRHALTERVRQLRALLAPTTSLAETSP